MSFGAVVSTLKLYQLEVVSVAGADFILHTAFLCMSKDTECITKDDPENEENQCIVAVLSSKNLLLNGYVAKQQGSTFSIHVNASYWYHKNDWLCYVPVSVTSLNQDMPLLPLKMRMHVFIFEAIKYQIECIMKKRMSNCEFQDYI
jgi:hypothetical protein